jgi:hypothetical protein
VAVVPEHLPVKGQPELELQVLQELAVVVEEHIPVVLALAAPAVGQV